MHPEIFNRFPRLRIAVAGDFCLDRYLEIDPEKQELSIETGLPVHNVVRVRSQPGGAGTILNNLSALGIGEILPVGFCGEDGEGYELLSALRRRRGVRLDHFLQTSERRTFTYCKPLVLTSGAAPRELSRLDSKNWTPTPPVVRRRLAETLRALATEVDALILLDQVDLAETGVVTPELLAEVHSLCQTNDRLLIMADSRRGLRDYPPVCLKMNGAELATLTGIAADCPLDTLRKTAADLAARHGRPVFITLSERGILGAAPTGEGFHVPAFPVLGQIDIVGAGDAVTANLVAALAAGAVLPDAMRIAMAAASIVIHQLGTTGTATSEQIRDLLRVNR